MDWKKVLKIGTEVSKPFVPGAAGSIIDIVSHNIADDSDPDNSHGLEQMSIRIENLEKAVEILASRIG